MKKIIFLYFVVVGVVWQPYFAQAQVWEKVSNENTDIFSIYVCQDQAQTMYVGSKNAVLKTSDGGSNWRRILRINGSNAAANFITTSQGDRNKVIVATGNGLFVSFDRGQHWRRIFRGRNYLESQCMVVLAANDSIYLGTKGGLFISRDQGRTWNKEIKEFGDSSIYSIVSSCSGKGDIYIASSKGVFKKADQTDSWVKIFTTCLMEEGKGIDYQTADYDGQLERASDIKYLVLDPNFSSCLYLTTDKGVYKSIDSGNNWRILPEYGLLDKNTKFLLVASDSSLYASTRREVYKFEEERWKELSFGLVAENIKFLAFDQNALLVASEKGLFRNKIKDLPANDFNKTLTVYDKNEPDISDVQKQAIKYAEVEPEKIMLWRKQAACKALLPKVSAGVNRDTGDIWHWESGSSTKSYDDVLMKGNDSLGWDVSVSWDLGEIIWNSDQTSIDARSRLMVELRNDIVDEVTKTYFERIRVKMELDNLPIEDRKKRFEKELRLKELTAMLDAFTGGYFSLQINVSKNKT